MTTTKSSSTFSSFSSVLSDLCFLSSTTTTTTNTTTTAMQLIGSSILFVSTGVVGLYFYQQQQRCRGGFTARGNSEDRTSYSDGGSKATETTICLVDEDNRLLFYQPPSQHSAATAAATESGDGGGIWQDGKGRRLNPPKTFRPWYRSTFLLIIHEPPHMFYEPKEWSCTQVLMQKKTQKEKKDHMKNVVDHNVETSTTTVMYSLPGGPVLSNKDNSNGPTKKDDSGGGRREVIGEDDDDQSIHNYWNAALRQLKYDYGIDVCLPHNCLHHLFTFPYMNELNQQQDRTDNKVTGVHPDFDSQPLVPSSYGGVWGDFYECVYREEALLVNNSKNNVDSSLELFTLLELKEMLDDDVSNMNLQDRQQPPFFTDETRHALRLFFQRQHDLRARRRLLKGYSSADLQKYGLRSDHHGATRSSSSNLSNNSGGNRGRLVLSHAESSSDFLDSKQEAVEYTMRTDDGMSPHLLYKADVILLGVSRAGKTPLSIYMSQTLGLKVANIPLVLELPPPSQLTDRGRVDPRRVFCLTLQPEFLEMFRKSRFTASGGRPPPVTASEQALERAKSRRNDLSIRDYKENDGSIGSSGIGGSTKNSIGSFRGLYGKDKKNFSYSQSSYVERDLDHARSLVREYGYTELDVTGRAMEETASLIVSKLKERFPDTYVSL